MRHAGSLWFRLLIASSAAIAFVPATAAPLPCVSLQASIANKISANGVKAYFLAIVLADEVDGSDDVVGSCDGGTKRILYERATGVQVTGAPTAAFWADYGADACILVKAGDIQILARKVPSFWGQLRQGSVMRASASGCGALKAETAVPSGSVVALTVKGVSINQLANGRASFRYLIFGSKV